MIMAAAGAGPRRGWLPPGLARAGVSAAPEGHGGGAALTPEVGAG
jgi:hypothetical protein